MPKPAFTIESVTVEGFKAFRQRQTLHLGGKHIFLFGPNGYGKTSVIESIRWCLFGLAARGGETVKNQFYEGTCTVQLSLTGPDGVWTLQRWLGAERSPLTVRDPSGQRRDVEDVFPQLSRIGPSESAHVIYAAQHPASRRPEADITDFSYVVYRYLGLEEVPRLLAVLRQLLRNWEVAEGEVLRNHDDLGQRISNRLTDAEERLSRITSDPPWGDEPSPVFDTTRSKVYALVEEVGRIGAQLSVSDFSDISLDELLDHIERAVNHALSAEEEPLQQRLTALTARRARLQEIIDVGQSSLSWLDEAIKAMEEANQKLVSLLKDGSVEDLHHHMEEVERKLQKSQHSVTIIDSALKYLSAAGGDTSHAQCPVCDDVHEADRLKGILLRKSQEADPAAREALEEYKRLEDQIRRAKELERDKAAAMEQRDQWQSELTDNLSEAQEEFENPGLTSIDELVKLAQGYDSSVQELKDAINSKEDVRKRWSVRIDELRDELRFHRLRNLQSRLHLLHEKQYEALRDEIRELGSFRDAVNEIYSRLSHELGQALESVLPPVADQMTDVYRRLTEQPIFDSIRIEHRVDSQEGAPGLELKVASSKGAGTWSIKHGVLNGQALNALHLVPYFVFSHYQEEPLLDLLLLDDPTQSFDTHRIDLLLKELADATSHAHLLVATHEDDRLLPALKNHFDLDKVKVLKTVGLDDRGPHFEDITERL